MPAFTLVMLHHQGGVEVDCAASQGKKTDRPIGVENNQGKISVLNTIIDFKEFKKKHPGGEAVLDPRMDGCDVTRLMKDHASFHFQRGVVSGLNTLIEQHKIAKGTLPPLPTDVANEIASKLHGEAVGPDEMDHGGGNKEPILTGDYSTFFDKDGTTPRYFRRRHGPEQGNPNEVIIEGVDQEITVIDRAEMADRDDLVEVVKPIICAGVRRSKFIEDGKKVSGTSWGKQDVTADGHIIQGADAIGNVTFNVLPLSVLVGPVNQPMQWVYDILSYGG